MGLEILDLPLLVDLRRKFPAGSRLAVLGDCRFFFDDAELERAFSRTGQSTSPTTLASFANAFGFDEAATFDIAGEPTFRVDLAQPIAPEFLGRYDCVLDIGTLFWCFDVSAVMRNVLDMLKPNGCVFHISALTGYFGRGYYAMQPRLFRDFYQQNGFDVVTMGTRSRMTPRSAIDRLMHRLRGGHEDRNWRLMSPDQIYLSRASRWSLEFSETPPGAAEPQMVPNNAVLMCFASRGESVDYGRPVLAAQ